MSKYSAGPRQFFDQCFRQFGDSFKSVGWHSRETQHSRFLMLSLVGDMDGCAVLDVGCGLGDFYQFCRDEQMSIQYTGIDVSAPMIQLAASRYTGARFLTQDFFDYQPAESFDYVVASGAFSYRVDDPVSYVRLALSRMFEMADRAVAVNFLSTQTPERDRELDYFNYFDPDALMKIAFELTPYVELKHHYLPNDMTLILHK